MTLAQIALWLLAIVGTAAVVAWLVDAVQDRADDRAAFDPELLARFRAENRKIALRRSQETAKAEPRP